jgi:hypothetical protein
VATTKSRRGRPKGKKSAAKAAPSNGGEKLSVVDKRLEGVKIPDQRKAVKMLANEQSINDVAKFLKLSPVKAKYMVMQRQVEDGDVPKISATNGKAIVKALKSDSEYGSVAWVACRTGLSDGAVKKIAEEAGHSFERGRPASNGSGKSKSTKGAGKAAAKGKGKSTARRGGRGRRKAANPS